MKIGLVGKFDDWHVGAFFGQLKARIVHHPKFSGSVDELNTCLCHELALGGFDVLVSHSCNKYFSDEKPESCWTVTGRVVESNPKTQFYIFAMNKPARKAIIGEHSNLIYVDEQNNEAFFNNPFEYMQEHKM